eukprot:739843_1
MIHGSVAWRRRLSKWFTKSDEVREVNVELQRYVVNGDLQRVLNCLGNGVRAKHVSAVFQDAEGNTSTMLATIHGNADILRVLTNFDSSGVRVTNFIGEAPIHAAVDQNALEMAQILLDCGADPNALYNRKSPLMIASENCAKQIFRLLLRFCADPNIKFDGRVAADFAPTPLRSFFEKSVKSSGASMREEKEKRRSSISMDSMLRSDSEVMATVYDFPETLHNIPQLKHCMFVIYHVLRTNPFGDTHAALNLRTRHECVVKRVPANTFDEINMALNEAMLLSLFRDVGNITRFQDIFVHLGNHCRDSEFQDAIRIMNHAKPLGFEDRKSHFTVNIAMSWPRGDLRALVSSRRGSVFNPETLSAQTLRPVDT